MPQLKTGKRLPVFEEISKMKFENLIKETNTELVEKCTEILKKNLQKIEDKKDEMSNSFCSEKSSRENSMSDSTIKGEENEESDEIKNTDFLFLSDLNFALDIFSNQN